MEKDSDSGEEEEKETEENPTHKQNGHMNKNYSNVELENYLILLEEFKDSFSEEEFKTLTKLVKGRSR